MKNFTNCSFSRDVYQFNTGNNSRERGRFSRGRDVSCVRTSTSTYQLGTGQSMRDGETLVSVDGSFELGFFNPKTGTSRYLGVWYRDASRNPTVAWVANRERPLQSTSGLLKFSDKGIL
ncbi:hypothetical protein Ahy_B02g061555 isoform C [Arachis hypogaea]|uniref:Bulb-type lectin domain-containing protein n=1 Tax=Arachis hypogaea TaxID=3818 RepID=A0A445AL86_ARAHY|nr:hypothetical protein Ahy_B02g061555 isoform C [Arachis hypogaea]